MGTKPFLSKKGSSSNNHITLSENGEIINDPAKVSEVFNDFFINVAKNIGNTNVIVNKEHPSVCMIKEKLSLILKLQRHNCYSNK